MTEIVDEIKQLFELYPPWLVTTCLVIVGAGLIYLIWRLVKFGMILVITLLLIALVGAAGWFIFAG